MKKVFDLAVKTGSYTNRNGENKNRYVTVGSVMQNDDGGQFIVLDRTFNPAGVPNPDNKQSIIISMFAPKDKPQVNNGQPSAAHTGDAADTPFNDADVPF